MRVALIPTGDPLGPKATKTIPAKSVRKRESSRERKAREQEEIKVAVANIPDAVKLPKTDSSRLGTDSARAKVEEALAARISPVSSEGLPPPESARPLVSVALPPRAEPVAEPPKFAPQPAPQEVAASTSSSPVVLPQSTAPEPGWSTPVMTAPPISVSPISVPPISVPTATTPVPAQITASNTVALQGPTPTGAPIAASVMPVAAAAVEPVISAPVAQPPPSPAFDLASIVSAIEIPESEQTPSAIAVDLKKIKPVAPKVAAVEVGSKTAKIDPKIAAKAKSEAANPARFWVQIATGEASALGYDYRKWSKKSADLFKGQSGWTSAWGKTDRLLVGPFADQKAAKKWEGDFRKAGGDGFMWKSENGVAVTALKSK